MTLPWKFKHVKRTIIAKNKIVLWQVNSTCLFICRVLRQQNNVRTSTLSILALPGASSSYD